MSVSDASYPQIVFSSLLRSFSNCWPFQHLNKWLHQTVGAHQRVDVERVRLLMPKAHFRFRGEFFISEWKLLQLWPAGSSQNRLPRTNSATIRRFQVELASSVFVLHSKVSLRSASGGNCFNCGQPGHRKIDCPSLATGESAVSGGFRSSGVSGACFNCGQTGHRKADCPSAVAGGSSRPPMVCFK